MSTTEAARVRERLGHPVIDADGHFIELGPMLDDELAAHLEHEGGAELRDRFRASTVAAWDTTTALADRQSPEIRAQWRAMPSWWGWPTENTLDHATAYLPKLLHERLDDLGIDFALLYPSATLSYLELEAELAGPVARAVNRYFASQFGPYGDRMAAAAIIPMTTPDIAIAEVRFAVEELGFKTIVIGGFARRWIGEQPPSGPRSYRLDTFGIDSDYDYDPFWAECVRLGVAPVSHSSHRLHRVNRSISNYVYNHVGGLATAHEALAKAMFLGGVTNRFPALRFGFLEGGVAWGVSLYADLFAHWEKRNGNVIHRLDPSRLDVDGVMTYVEKYGDDNARASLDRVRAYFARPGAHPTQLDEFSAVGISEPDDFRRRFVEHFYFGCEADDPLITWAFNDKVNPLGAQLRPIFGSDIAHWDVPDMLEPVPEAFELVEHGMVTEAQFRDFTFLNAVRLHASMNPKLFEGTVCEAAVAQALAEEASTAT